MDFLRMPDDRDRRGNSDRGRDQVAVQIVNLRNSFLLEGHDDIAFLQTRPFRRAARLKARHQHAAAGGQSVVANHARVDGHVLSGHANPTAPDPAFFDQPM